MQNLILIINLVAPVFIIVILGSFLKRIGLINDNFVSYSSKIVFTVSLPALIFIEISSIKFEKIFDLNLILFAFLITILSFIFSWMAAGFLSARGKDKAALIQGSFRGNFAIIGLAIVANVYGTDKLGKASLLLAFVIPLYNILSVIALTIPLRKERELKLLNAFFQILKNPLIIAVIVALPFSIFQIPVHLIIQKTGNYLASLTLPLALLGVGGFMSFKDIRSNSGLAISSSLIKLIFIPLGGTYFAYLLGYSGDDLGILFILFASPTAITSFIMAEAMGANSRLAGNILLYTTFGSIITITLGLFILVENQLI